MAAHPKRKYTLEEYFELERSTGELYEYWNGEVFCMSGVSEEHDQIEGNAYADGSWRYSEINELSGSLHLASVDCVLKLTEIYQEVSFPASPSPNLREPGASAL